MQGSDRTTLFLNILSFFIIIVLMSATQSSFLPLVLGSFSTPMLWLVLTVYMSLYRSFEEALAWIYTISIVNWSVSYSPIAFFLLSQVVVLLGARALKERIFWHGTSYFIMANLGALAIYHLSYFGFSLLFESNPMVSPFWWSWLIQTLWSPFVAAICYFLFQLVDSWTKRVVESELGHL